MFTEIGVFNPVCDGAYIILDPSVNIHICMIILALLYVISFLVNRNGFVSAKYLPLRLTFDSEFSSNRCLHVRPSRDPRWTDVCSDEDKHCLLNNNLIAA